MKRLKWDIESKNHESTFGKGTYILILRLREAQDLRIGRLGEFRFQAGSYAYVGSAFGSGGLSGRLKHHLTPTDRPFWHIDYLGKVAHLDDIWFMESNRSREHEWAALLLELPGAMVPVSRFGASDCRCESHLVEFHQRPPIRLFRKLIRERYPKDEHLRIAEKKRKDLGVKVNG